MDTGWGAICSGNLPLALSAARTAEAAVALAAPTSTGEEIDRAVQRCRAECRLLFADISTRNWRLLEAEAHLDGAYRGLKDEPSFDVAIARCTARLAERRGRWPSAIAGWTRVESRLHPDDLQGLADVRIRMAELELIRGNAEAAMVSLLKADAICLELRDDVLRARVRLVHATVMELKRELGSALALYDEVQRLSARAPRVFTGLVRLRKARPLVRLAPERALMEVEMGFLDLSAGGHPDAEGLTFSQIAVLALILEQPAMAALAAATAESWRGGRDGTNRPLLHEAIEAYGYPSVAAEVEQIERGAIGSMKLRRLLDPLALQLRVRWPELQSTCTVSKLLVGLQHHGEAQVVVRTNATLSGGRNGLLLRQRASLTWDVPWRPGFEGTAPERVFAKAPVAEFSLPPAATPAEEVVHPHPGSSLRWWVLAWVALGGLGGVLGGLFGLGCTVVFALLWWR